ncbi:MAG: hypothetical protein A2020_08415 [Lentisphaerae bacterium GWF2_45_14]|nr:MAG: hypothetical protein A2020_08415 [Lentisphaerae bacterium GWF2_45_14]
MLFKSDKFKAQWDTWGYYHNKTYYLYYLITEDSPGEGFGVAVSTDGVHWDDHGWAIKASDKMKRYLGSGAVWKSLDFEDSGRFICNYSEYREDEYGKNTQNIYFAWSIDLINWTKYGDDYVFSVDERFYERYGRWDNVFSLPRPDGGFWGVWVGTPKGKNDLEGGIAFGYSGDGLKWHAIKAGQITPDAKEAGGLWRFGDKFYGMFGSPQKGIMSYISDSIDGPYQASEKNAILLSAGHSYFPRYLETPEEILVVHHSMSGRRHIGKENRAVTYVAPLKRAEVDNEGVLRFKYWKGNEALKGSPIEIKDQKATPEMTLLTDFQDFTKGLIVEGTMETPAKLFVQADNISYVLNVDENGCMTIEQFAPFGGFAKEIQSVNREYSFPPSVNFRLLLRRGMLEFYLDDEFMECCTLQCPDCKNIRIGIMGDESKKGLSNIKAWAMFL